MPRSENRHQIEIPNELYQELRDQAAREGVTMAELLRGYVTDGRTMRDWYGEIAGELAEIKRELRRLAESSSR